MHSDCFFFTGKTHDICQDYTRCGSINNFNYAILSDGCSSSPNTDIGSRILTCCAENYLSFTDSIEAIGINGQSIINQAQYIALNFPGITYDSLDATLLVAASNTEHTWISVYGDGLVVFIDANDNIEINDIEFTSGAPRYLTYLTNPDRLAVYKQKFGEKAIIRQTINGKIKEMINEVHEVQTWKLVNKFYKAVILFSDGAKSFSKREITDTSKISVPISYQDIIKELVAYKGYQGEFIKRRTKRFMKDMIKLGWENFDDVSVAGISFE
jgi:hypothetical protein